MRINGSTFMLYHVMFLHVYVAISQAHLFEMSVQAICIYHPILVNAQLIKKLLILMRKKMIQHKQ